MDIVCDYVQLTFYSEGLYQLRDLGVSAANRDVFILRTTAAAGGRTVWNLVLWVDNLYLLLCVCGDYAQNCVIELAQELGE